MVPGYWPPRVVKREPGPATVSGAGDILTDSDGKQWIIVDRCDRSSTASECRTLHPDGTIR